MDDPRGLGAGRYRDEIRSDHLDPYDPLSPKRKKCNSWKTIYLFLSGEAFTLLVNQSKARREREKETTCQKPTTLKISRRRRNL